MKIISHSIAETEAFAARCVELFKLGNSDKNLVTITPITSSTKKVSTFAHVVGLYGDLGSGKTAFSQAVAKLLGVTETVTSPTYVIEKIYSLDKKAGADAANSLPTVFKHLIHIDAYRIEKSEELIHLGWKNLLSDPENLILIEWPERVADIMPPDHIRLQFTFIDETTREIEILGFTRENK